MTASETMGAALVEMTDHHETPPCAHDPGAWTSEHQAERQWAAQHCAGCQLLDLCNALADELHVRFGTWGGRDRTPRQRGHHE